MSFDRKAGLLDGADPLPSSASATSSPSSLVGPHHAGIAPGPTPDAAEHPRLRTPRIPRQGVPTSFAEKLAAMKASAFNVELEMLRHSKDPNAKYKLQDILERADDTKK